MSFKSEKVARIILILLVSVQEQSCDCVLKNSLMRIKTAVEVFQILYDILQMLLCILIASCISLHQSFHHVLKVVYFYLTEDCFCLPVLSTVAYVCA